MMAGGSGARSDGYRAGVDQKRGGGRRAHNCLPPRTDQTLKTIQPHSTDEFTRLYGGTYSAIEDSSCVRVPDQDIFSRHVTGRPSDEGARLFVRNKQGKDSLSRTRRLEELYIFQLEVVTVVNDYISFD